MQSLDCDLRSVAATRGWWEQAGRPAQWMVAEGSLLDAAMIDRLRAELFVVVYSWGARHHTGVMWTPGTTSSFG